MKTLVTGSSGHLGEALVRTLHNMGREVVSLDIKEAPFTTHIGSVTDRNIVAECMKDVGVVFHTATLHKPHVATHTAQDFVDTNISGTLVMLEAAKKAGVDALVFTSTTSTYGDALRPPSGTPAAWVVEDTLPVPKNIYGTTKTAAEDLCRLFHRKQGVNCIVLKTSRFFPEVDDDRAKRVAYTDANIKVSEFLFRRVELEDVVSAHLLASQRAPDLGFGRYIISATTPFLPEDRAELNIDARAVVERRVPDYLDIYADRNWEMFDTIDRVYVNTAARRYLGWQPKYDFAFVLHCLRNGLDWKSPLSKLVGAKGYHDQVFEDGPFPVDKAT